MTFAPGETEKSVLVEVKGDEDHEPDETFAVALDFPAWATLAKGEAVGSIQNDDARPPADVFTLVPCRLLDTRTLDGPTGGQALGGRTTNLFPVAGLCGVPPAALAVSANVTAVQATAAGHLTLYPGDQSVAPTVSNVNFSTGQTRANNAILLLATDGTGSIRVKNGSVGSVHVVLDVNGYFE